MVVVVAKNVWSLYVGRWPTHSTSTDWRLARDWSHFHATRAKRERAKKQEDDESKREQEARVIIAETKHPPLPYLSLESKHKALIYREGKPASSFLHLW